MEKFISKEFLQYNQQAIQQAKKDIELVFMNSLRICPITEHIDYEFTLQ
jgi:hypothetical protein